VSRRQTPTTAGEFGGDYWEGRYRTGHPTGLDDPSPALVAETGALPPALALDAGCGRGADGIWLASRGWQVTAVDVSATALARARGRARAAGDEVADRIDFVHADLAGWHPDGRQFDLVTSHYVHLPGPADELFCRLASWVAPGGTLLVVGHDSRDGLDDQGHAHPPAAQIRTEQITAGLPEDRWEIVVAESRTQQVQRPDGAGVVPLHDVVVRARRA
jgi:SAM-dependent methyltransferase